MLHALLGAQAPGERRLAGEALAPVGAAGRAVGGKAHAFELDRDVRDRERDRLAV